MQRFEACASGQRRRIEAQIEATRTNSERFHRVEPARDGSRGYEGFVGEDGGWLAATSAADLLPLALTIIRCAE